MIVSQRHGATQGVGGAVPVETHQGKAVFHRIDDIRHATQQFFPIPFAQGALEYRLLSAQCVVQQNMQGLPQAACIADVVSSEVEGLISHADRIWRHVEFCRRRKLAVACCEKRQAR